MITSNDFKKMWKDVGFEISKQVTDIFSEGNYILGSEVVNFEIALADYWDKEWAVGCGNGMDAIEIGLRSLGIKPGDKVLTTPLSAFASTLAIIRSGGIPVFVDTDRLGLIDLDLADRALSNDALIKFMVPVHLYGIPLDLEKLRSLKSKYGLKIVEDCAQAIGATFDSIKVGNVGDLVALSFYPTKNLGAFGDGGAILGNELKLKESSRTLRNYGESTTRYHHSHIGLNSRLDEVQAGILLFLLKNRLENYLLKRKNIAKKYLKGIKNKKIALPTLNSKQESVWHLFPVMVNEGRDNFRDYCKSKDVQTGVHYPILIPEQTAMHVCKEAEVVTSLENARRICLNEVSLPIHPYLTDLEIEKVIDVCNGWK